MQAWEILAKDIEAAYRASAAVDAAMERTGSGQIEIRYRLQAGEALPGIDTGFLSPRGLAAIAARARSARAGYRLTRTA